jgi:myo-inositol-1(or 4)-monophosphatase
MPDDLIQYLEFATETAFLAGKLTLDYYQTGIRPEFKFDDTPVTVADREAEKLIRTRINHRYPHHRIIGEEFGDNAYSDSDFRWFIDPIDGTKSFVRGVPLYAVLIGLEIAGKVEVGVAYYPALDEMLTAATGNGCWWNGKRTHVSTISSFDKAIVTTTDPGNFATYNREDAWNRIQKAFYYRTGWGDAYGYLLVATGRVELMLDPAMSVWDCAPFPPILAEAGGYFGDWQGKRTIYANESIATSNVLLPEVLKLIVGPAE